MVRERAGLAFGGVTDYSRTTRHVCMYALMPGRAGRGMTFGGGHFRHQIGPFFLFFFFWGRQDFACWGAPWGVWMSRKQKGPL